MKLSRASTYAVLSVLAIAKHQREDPGGTVQIKEIVAEHDLPREYVGRLLTQLVKTKILTSGRGRDGGFALRRRASEIPVLDIIEAVDGPLEADDLLNKLGSGNVARDNVKGMFKGAMETLRTELKESTIERLMG